MSKHVITVVVGPPGVGKTTWIRQQLAQATEPVLYFSPATGTVPIDQTRIVTEDPEVKILVDSQESQLLEHLAAGMSAYIELGFHLDLEAMEELLAPLSYRRVALVPPVTKDSEWHRWASEIVVGGPVKMVFSATQVWRACLTSQVIDSDSLEVFWSELIQGAYGTVYRAKGIFDVADGRVLYADFVATKPEGDFEELSLPRWLEGHPQRFSGLEVVGQDLEQAAIDQTLQDCCLSEAAIRHYQQQIKESLESTEEVLT